MLDDARAGMNPDIRPQDDLFGHVNGRWFDETEIPSDRSSWGSFTMLREAAEQHVRQIIEELAQETHEPGSNGQKIGDLFASFMDEDRVERLGAEPIRADLERVAGISDRSELAAFVGALERRGGGGFFGAYVDTDDRNSDRYIVNLLQGGLGLPDESYYRDDKFSEIRTKYLAHLERMFALVELDDPAGAAQRVMAVETRLAKGHWERAATRDVIKTYNLRTLAEVKGSAPSFDWDTWAAALGCDESTLAEVCVRQPSYFEHLSATIDEVDLEDWKASDLVHIAAHGQHNQDNPLFSSIRMADGPLYAYDVPPDEPVAGHIVLSACDLGLTTPRAGGEVLGLTAALLSIGATSVVSSVSRVDDTTAYETMLRYHRLLAAGLDSPTALAEALDGDVDMPAPFVCFGSPWSATR